jgi:NH3-dependent NAD+ synthetase
MEQSLLNIIDHLRGRLSEDGFKGFVVGINNSIDGILIPTFCAQTGFPTIVVNLVGSPEDEKTIAESQMEWLKKYPNVTLFTINMQQHIYRLENELWPFIFDFNKHSDLELSHLVSTNLIGEQRNSVLHAFATASNFVMLGDLKYLNLSLDKVALRDYAIKLGIPLDLCN